MKLPEEEPDVAWFARKRFMRFCALYKTIEYFLPVTANYRQLSLRTWKKQRKYTYIFHKNFRWFPASSYIFLNQFCRHGKQRLEKWLKLDAKFDSILNQKLESDCKVQLKLTANLKNRKI